MDIKNEIKAKAIELGADLVGFAGIERYKNAPIEMSPQGLLPEAKSIVVMAIHHPDSVIELDAEEGPQAIGPYHIQGTMNEKLDYMSISMAKFLKKKGFIALPIVSSNIWRYRPYKNTNVHFQPDISHIHAACCAGLGEIGWNGLLLTPEYGPRQRFITVITNIPLESDPMYNGPALCDRCMMCVKHCPTQAFTKETNGKSVVEIGGRKFEYVNKSKWRCSWAENFGLDLSLPKPEKITFEVISENLEKHGYLGGELGSCLKFCMPPHLRIKDEKYSSTYRRKKMFNETGYETKKGKFEFPNRLIAEKLVKIADDWSVNFIKTLKASDFANTGKFLSDTNTVILTGYTYAGDDKYMKYLNKQMLNFYELDVCRMLDEHGHSAMPRTKFPVKEALKKAGMDPVPVASLRYRAGELADSARVILTSAVLDISGEEEEVKEVRKGIKEEIEKIADKRDAELIGFAPIARFKNVKETILSEFSEEELGTYVEDKKIMGIYGIPEPEIVKIKPEIKMPEDYVKNAKTVIVVGFVYPEEGLKIAKKPPAEAIGPYAFTQFQSLNQVGYIGFEIMKFLEKNGYKAMATLDLTNTASKVISSRGLINDNTSNRYAAVAAGLGIIGWNGAVITKFGVNQKFIAIITDAELEPTPLTELNSPCNACKKCVPACYVSALDEGKKVSWKIEDKTYSWIKTHRLKCDWSKRYGFIAEEGPKYLGHKLDAKPPEKITMEEVAKTMLKKDPLQKRHTCIVENCIRECYFALNK